MADSRLLAVVAGCALAPLALVHCSASGSSSPGTSFQSSGSSGLGSGSGSGQNSGAGSGSSGGGNDNDATVGPQGGDGGAGDDGPIGPITDSSCAANNWNQTSFINLAPPMLSALNRTQSDPLPNDAGVTTPSGWNFYLIDGSICRDGSPNGIFVRYSSDAANMDKLMIYFEGGGACLSPHFCDHTPA
ncbi:MAG: hypothetical protein ACREJ3_13290, partial [Polyangiaceae bacterium]